MTDPIDVVVVGSGPAGAQAAQTLAEAGCRVTVVDVGRQPDPRLPKVPERPFAEIRRDDPRQHEFLLGPDFSGIPLERLGAAPQVTPPRRHVVEARSQVAGFAALESHALGGLGAAWGAVSFPYLDHELERSGLPVEAMRRSYERVARRIGISGTNDDLLAVRGALAALQPAPPADHNARALLSRYERKRAQWQRRGLWLGRPVMAMLSEPLGERGPNPGHDLEFWANPNGSVYRPELTIRALVARGAITYEAGWKVERFVERRDGVTVEAVAVAGGERRSWHGRRVVLAAGALGTCRIVLHSLGLVGRRVPLVCNPHLYIPCIHAPMIGQPHAERCHSLAQLTMIYDPTGRKDHLVQAQMYSYRSLLLFRLLKESPLPWAESWRIVQALAPSLVVWAVEHEAEPSESAYCTLREGLPPQLEISVQAEAERERAQRRAERVLMRGLCELGSWPLRRVHSGPGSSLHYGGMFPATEREQELTTDAMGRLRGTQRVHVVDGAALAYLPAKGLTFTIMANAERVAGQVAAVLLQDGGRQA